MRAAFVLATVGIVSLTVAATPARARDCADPASAATCASNLDCGCGSNRISGACQVAAPECLAGGGECARFCGFGDIVRVCRQAQCIRARATRCIGDCNADTRVEIAELIDGVDIALGAQAIAACRAFDDDRDQGVVIAELVSAVGAALNGCVAASDAASAGRRLYDAAINGVIEGLGRSFETAAGASLTLYFAPNSSANLTAVRAGDDLSLEGLYFFTDIGVEVTGTAHVTQDGAVEIIAGTLMSSFPAPNMPASFEMRRSGALNPQRFAGRYEVAFDPSPGGSGGSSRAVLALEVGAGGSALAGEGRDVFDGGGPAGRLTTAECMVAPEGHLYCSGAYLDEQSGAANPLRLVGVLPATDSPEAPGGGSFLTGVDPPFDVYVGGRWTAVRVAATTTSTATIGD